MLELLDLRVLQLDRGRPAEDRDRHLEPALGLVDLLDHPAERGERAVGDADVVARHEGDRGLGVLDALGDLVADPVGLVVRNRRRLAARAQETRHLGGVAHQRPGLVVEGHLDHDVAREELALGRHLLAAADLDHFFHGHQNLLEQVTQALLLRLLLDRLLHLLLEAGVDVDDEPARLRHQAPNPRISWTPSAITWSTTKKNSAASADIASTLSVVATVSLRVGQVTLASSCRTSRMNWAGEL